MESVWLRRNRTCRRDQHQRNTGFGAAFVRRTTRNYQHVTLVKSERGSSFRCWGEPLAGLGVASAFWCSSDLVEGRPVEDLKDVVTSFVIFKLLRGLVLLRRQDDGERQRLGVEQAVIAWLRLKRLHRIRKLIGCEYLKWLWSRDRSPTCGAGGCEKELLREGKTDRGGDGRRSQEVAASLIFDHAKVDHIYPQFAKNASCQRILVLTTRF
jgi:hypothetical protein